MANPISTFAIDNTQVYQVVAATYCRRILIQENFNSVDPPTADLIQYMPYGSSTPVNIAMGTAAIYTALGELGQFSFVRGEFWFVPGQVVGGIMTRTGSITVQKIESAEI